MIGWLRRLFGVRQPPRPSPALAAWIDVVTERQTSKQGDPLLYRKPWGYSFYENPDYIEGQYQINRDFRRRLDEFEFDPTIDVQPIPKASK